jgi:hypothetical protein
MNLIELTRYLYEPCLNKEFLTNQMTISLFNDAASYFSSVVLKLLCGITVSWNY